MLSLRVVLPSAQYKYTYSNSVSSLRSTRAEEDTRPTRLTARFELVLAALRLSVLSPQPGRAASPPVRPRRSVCLGC
jgi:hypothetical protein